MSLKVNEIFYSIQGESTFVGMPCVFIRLTGCNLRCRYCDTKYAYEEGRYLSIAEILDEVKTYQCNLVEITGGEPLIQKDVPLLSTALIKRGIKVLLETNGTLDIDLVGQKVVRIMDIKCPGSGEVDHTDWYNINKLRQSDEIKFVISDRQDFNWACDVLKNYNLSNTAKVLFAPVHGQLVPSQLAEWILQAQLPVRLQIQLHKYIWRENKRGV